MPEPTLEDVPCLDIIDRGPELISTIGHHCDVWQVPDFRSHGGTPRELVVKKYRQPCTFREVEVLAKEYRELRASLEDIVPNTLFVPVWLGDRSTVIAVSHAITPWFNLANPVNQDDAVPLLRTLPKAQNQLLRFCHAARKWAFEKRSRIIDLYGLDNLVLDTDREIRYLDSFHVFFYSDIFSHLDEEDEALQRRVEISIKRREYLEYLLEETKGPNLG